MSINISYWVLSGVGRLKNCVFYKSVNFLQSELVDNMQVQTHLYLALSWSAAENNQVHRFVPEASLNQIGYSIFTKQGPDTSSKEMFW